MGGEWRMETGEQFFLEVEMVFCVHGTVIIGVVVEWRVESGNRRVILSRSWEGALCA
jgi:hypothetical protein